jgi:hypothetical protein
MSSVSELQTDIQRLAHRAWRIQGTITGPGPQRDALIAELKEVYAEKQRLMDLRDKLKREADGERFLAEMGGQTTQTNDSRSAEIKRAELAERESRSKAHFQADLDSLGGILKPVRF